MTDDFDPASIAWVMNTTDLQLLLDAIHDAPEVIFDLETTGLDEHAVIGGASNGGVAARIVLASLTVPADVETDREPTTWVMPLSHPSSPWLGQWRRAWQRVALELVNTRTAVIGHNVKFDCRWTYALTGVDLSGLIAWDTQVSSHLLDENDSTKLKERAPKTFGVERWDDHDLGYPGAAEDVPIFDLGTYAARDTYWTWRLALLHRDQMNLIAPEAPTGPDEVEDARLGRLAVRTAIPTAATLTAMEQRGMLLDLGWVRRELDDLTTQAAATHIQLAHRYPGLDPREASFAPTSLWFQRWTQAAVDAGDLVVGGMTPGGKPQWSKQVLTRQARQGRQVAAELLRWRQATKRAEFLRSWLDKVTPADTIHCTYRVGSVVTGRLSSSDPNMQQVTSALKPAFVPREGYYLAELDYSQIELRVAAHIAQCQPMIDAFIEGEDLHRLLAARMTGKHPADVTKEERQLGKAGNFGLLYSMSAEGFWRYAEDAYGVEMTLEEAQATRKAFFEVWDGIAAWHASAIARVHRDGQVVSPLGRVRRLPGVWDGSDHAVGEAERAAINSPVQGMASDLMQMAAARIEGTYPGSERLEQVRLVGTVHDSIIAEVPADSWEEALAACIRTMTDTSHLQHAFGITLSVPLAVEAHVGTRWGLADVGVMEG